MKYVLTKSRTLGARDIQPRKRESSIFSVGQKVKIWKGEHSGKAGEVVFSDGFNVKIKYGGEIVNVPPHQVVSTDKIRKSQVRVKPYQRKGKYVMGYHREGGELTKYPKATREATAHQIGKDYLVSKKKAKEYLEGKIGEPVKVLGLFDAISRGDRVTITNRFGQDRTGKAVMLGPGGWVLNMGGPHGTPGIATPDNVAKVKKTKEAQRMFGLTGEPFSTKRFDAGMKAGKADKFLGIRLDVAATSPDKDYAEGYRKGNVNLAREPIGELVRGIPEFDYSKMKKLIDSDAFLSGVFNKRITGTDVATANVMFNTYVIGDSVMESRYDLPVGEPYSTDVEDEETPEVVYRESIIPEIKDKINKLVDMDDTIIDDKAVVQMRDELNKLEIHNDWQVKEYRRMVESSEAQLKEAKEQGYNSVNEYWQSTMSETDTARTSKVKKGIKLMSINDVFNLKKSKVQFDFGIEPPEVIEKAQVRVKPYQRKGKYVMGYHREGREQAIRQSKSKEMLHSIASEYNKAKNAEKLYGKDMAGEMRDMHTQDAKDLTSVHEYWLKKDYDSAFNLATNMDTAARDNIPAGIWKEITANTKNLGEPFSFKEQNRGVSDKWEAKLSEQLGIMKDKLQSKQPVSNKELNDLISEAEDLRDFKNRIIGEPVSTAPSAEPIRTLQDTTSEERLQIASTILMQMGGAGKIKMMTGAKNFMALPSGVSFDFPNKGGPNHVKVTLEPNDTYTVEFGRKAGMKALMSGNLKAEDFYKQTSKHEGIYDDQLKELFEGQTGLYLSFNKSVTSGEKYVVSLNKSKGGFRMARGGSMGEEEKASEKKEQEVTGEKTQAQERLSGYAKRRREEMGPAKNADTDEGGDSEEMAI